MAKSRVVPLFTNPRPAATPQSITLAAGQHLDSIAAQNQQISAGQALVINAGQGISQFAHGGDLRQIAHQGQVLVQAQRDTIRLQADKSVEITATQDHVLVMADKHVTLLCGGAYIKLQGGAVEIGCPGPMTFKAASYNMQGPASQAADLPSFDVGDTRRRFVVTHIDGVTPMANVPYKIALSNGEVVEGITDAQGATQVLEKTAMHIADVQIMDPRKPPNVS